MIAIDPYLGTIMYSLPIVGFPGVLEWFQLDDAEGPPQFYAKLLDSPRT